MLTERQIEKLQTGILNLYGEIEFEIMRNIGRRLNITDEIGGSDEWRLKKLNENASLKRENIQVIAKYAERSEKEVKKLFTDATTISVEDDETEYLKGVKADLLKPQPPITESKKIQATVKKAVDDANDFLNLTHTTAIESASEEFLKVVNTTFLQVDQGLYGYETAIRRASLKLADQGIIAQTYQTEAGKIIRYPIDAAVRREVLTSSMETARKAQLIRAEEYGVKFVEVSSHSGARPSHAKWQGQVYELER